MAGHNLTGARMPENTQPFPSGTHAILSHPADRIAAELVRRRRAIGASQVAVASLMNPPTSAQYLGAHEQGRSATPEFRDRWEEAIADLEQLVERFGVALVEARAVGARPMAFSDLREIVKREGCE